MFYLKIIKIHFLKGHIWYNSYENKIFSLITLKNHLTQFTIMISELVHQHETMISAFNVQKNPMYRY